MAGEPVVTIVGNLTANPELNYIGNGTPVANFTVASTPRTQNRNTGEWVDGEAMFVRCAVWRDYAEHVAESLSKGMRVIVTGRLSVRSYESNGARQISLEMQVDEVGPSLRFATAQVSRAAFNGGNGGNNNYGGNNYGGGNYGGGSYGGGNFSGGGDSVGGMSYGQGGGQVTYGAPMGGSEGDQWSSPQPPVEGPPDF